MLSYVVCSVWWLSKETGYGCVEAHGFPGAVQLKLAQVKVLLGEKVCSPESRLEQRVLLPATS